jgi:hypothetical protein
MGKTAMSGPVYGAKGNLVSFGPIAFSNTSSAVVATAVVPPYESWYITEVGWSNTQTSSNSSTPKILVKVDGTPTADPAFAAGNPGTAVSQVGGTSTAAFNLSATATVTAGEFEGYAAPANSTIRILSSGTIGALFVAVHGFRRFIDSTRVNQ